MTFNLLFQSMKDYVHKYIILESKSELLITFSYFIYDLVDKDLDFNEDYYLIIIENLKDIIKNECLSLLPKFKKITINIGKLYMTQESCKMEETIIFEDGKTINYNYI